MTVTGKLKLPDEEVTITVWGKQEDGNPDPSEAYNMAKESIIAAEEKRREKIAIKLEEEKS